MTTTSDTNVSDFNTDHGDTMHSTGTEGHGHTGHTGPATTMTGGISSEQINASQKKKSANLLIIAVAAIVLFGMAGFMFYTIVLHKKAPIQPQKMQTLGSLKLPNANGTPGASTDPNATPTLGGTPPANGGLTTIPSAPSSPGNNGNTLNAGGINSAPASNGLNTNTTPNALGGGNNGLNSVPNTNNISNNGSLPTTPAPNAPVVVNPAPTALPNNQNNNALDAGKVNNAFSNNPPTMDTNNGGLETRVSKLEERMDKVEDEIAKLEKKEFSQIGERMKHVQRKVQSLGKTAYQKRVKKNNKEVKIPQVLTPTVLNPNPASFKTEIASIEPAIKNEVIVYQDDNTPGVLGKKVDGDVLFIKDSAYKPDQPEAMSSVPSKLQAVIPGRVWLRSGSGISVSYVVGDTLENGKTITGIDADHAVITLNDGTVIN